MPITIRKLLKSARRVTGRSRNDIIGSPLVLSDQLLEQDSSLAVICLIYLKSEKQIAATIDLSVRYGIGRPIKEGRTCLWRANAYSYPSPWWPCRAFYSKPRRPILSLPPRWLK